MFVRRASLITLFTATLLTLFPSSPIQRAEAASAPIYWGAYIDGEAYGYSDPPWDTRPMDAFEAEANKKMSIFHWGQSWMGSSGAFGEFQTSYFDKVRARGTIPMLTWQSIRSNYGSVQPDFQLSDIYGGRYDSYITRWANAAKAWGHPFFLRFDHEMNGSWYAYGEGTTNGQIINGNKTGDYVKAWRHVHDIFTAVGANNVTWLWCPNYQSASMAPLAGLYPGDSYVDWVAMDGYNRPGDWLTFIQLWTGSGTNYIQNTYQQLQTLAPSKPIMIAETASQEAGDGGTKKAAWITDALLTQLPTNFPKIKALVWFNWNDKPTFSWPIASTTKSKAAFAAGIASPYYAANTFSTISDMPIRPIATTSGAGSTTLTAVADTYIDSTNPDSTAGGSSTTLISHGVMGKKAFLRFDLATLSGKTISTVKLRIHTTPSKTAGSISSHSVNYLADVNWRETSVTHNNPPTIWPTVLGTIPASTVPDSWYDISLDATVFQPKAGALFSLAIQSDGTDGLVIDSRESANKPQLIISYK